MQASEQPILRDIVLIGGGHTHVVVLKNFGMNPMPGVRLTLICTDTHTPYSGMLPGYIAGHYKHDEVHIDLDRLAVFAGARLYRDEVVGIDRATRQVLCRNRPPVPYDVASINIGSTPQVDHIPGANAYAVPVKPIRQFNQRWLALLQRVRTHSGHTTIAVVGAGAGGVEMTLAMQYRLRNELTALGRNPDELSFHLFNSTSSILATHGKRVRQSFMRILQERGVQLHMNAPVQMLSEGQLRTAMGDTFDVDEVVWVTQACGASWLAETGLDLDDAGFVKVNDCLQTTADETIFAAGDVAAVVNHPREKAGVFAVRQGMPLANNLRLKVQGRALKPFRPQRLWLALLSTGNKYAIASRGSLGAEGAWIWRWKDWIDRGFMRKFAEFPAMPLQSPSSASTSLPALSLSQEESSQASFATAMRCGGCGAKVGATVLSRALGALKPVARDDVLIGLHAPDDAAVVRVPAGQAMVHTVDFFRSFIDDPYLFGKVAANHALSDIFAMGGEAQTATAIVTMPPGIESKLEDQLHQMMRGAIEVLNAANCALVGGHTGEGRELALGFAINGLVDDSLHTVMRKDGMRPGDVLLLTKPLGTGTLFAARDRFASKGRWIDAALQSMIQSNRQAAHVLRAHRVSACTDVTGFGLIGHLMEMAKPSGVDIHLNLSALPILDGAVETAGKGMLSSLHLANHRQQAAMRNHADFESHPSYPLLFDPQTAGGLLASVPADALEACLADLCQAGYQHTAVVGRVVEQAQTLAAIELAA